MNDRAIVIEEENKNYTCMEYISMVMKDFDYLIGRLFRKYKPFHPLDNIVFVL